MPTARSPRLNLAGSKVPCSVTRITLSDGVAVVVIPPGDLSIIFEMPFFVNDPSKRKKFGERTEIKIIIAILFAY